MDEVIFSIIIDWDEWEAWPYAWRSPLWAWLEYPAARRHGVTKFCEVRAYPSTPEPMPILTAAAKAGFYDLGASTLRAISQSVGLADGDDNKLFPTLCRLVKHVLKCSDDVCHSIVAGRLGEMGATRCAMASA